MKAATAIKKFTGANVTEIKELKLSCTEEEWKELGKQACEIMGEVFED